MLRNILSYPVGTIFSGKEIKDWIAYNLFHPSSKTLMAKRMEKYLNISDSRHYFLLRYTRPHALASDKYVKYIVCAVTPTAR